MSMEKGSNQCEDRKLVESGRVTGKTRIRASIEKIFRRETENGRIRASIEKLFERVPRKGSISVCSEKW